MLDYLDRTTTTHRPDSSIVFKGAYCVVRCLFEGRDDVPAEGSDLMSIASGFGVFSLTATKIYIARRLIRNPMGLVCNKTLVFKRR